MDTLESIDDRTEALLGKEALELLRSKKVAIFGIGGVGGFLFEALVRTGVGEIHVYDCDTVEESNLNRQILYLRSDIGRRKVDVAVERVSLIRNDVHVVPHFLRVGTETEDSVADEKFDLLLDAIDDVEGKLSLMEVAEKTSAPVISCLGTARRLDPRLLRLAPLSKTAGDPLAKKVRHLARERSLDLSRVLCVYSEEPALDTGPSLGSSMPVPGSAGLLMASAALRTLLGLY